MGKGKTKRKRMTKRQLEPMLQNMFTQHPNETFSLKKVFKQLNLLTHPEKMLAVDLMEEMAWDDYLKKVAENTYQLNLGGQVQEGS